jgi:hypothetical protein
MTTAAASDYALRQSLEKYEYIAGESTLVRFTVVNLEPETNVTKRAGFYHNSDFAAPYDGDLDGLWVSSDTANGVCFHSANMGTSTGNTCQGSWNVDNVNGGAGGLNPSGFNVDWTKIQLFWLDFQWLGAGRVRYGMFVEGVAIVLHEGGNFDGTLAVPYMRSPVQPLRWEIRQTGAGSGSFTQVCASVLIENGTGVERAPRSGAVDIDGVDSLNSGSIYAIGGLRLQANRLYGTPRLRYVTTRSVTNDDFRWCIKRNPTVAGAFTYGGVSGQSLEVAIGDNTNTVTGGLDVACGDFEAGAPEPIFLENYGKMPFHTQVDGTRDTLVFTVETDGTNATFTGTVTWAEPF